MNLEKNNPDIRLYVQASGLMYKDIAKQMGVSAEHLCRTLRAELKPQMRDRILTAIRKLRGDT